MQREINYLRGELGSNRQVEESNTTPSLRTSSIQEPSSVLANPTTTMIAPPVPSPALTAGFVNTGVPTPPIQKTKARALADFVVDAHKIDDCMRLYFENYHSQLPILDPSFTPDQYFDYSPIVFWSMLITGSRRYHDDPMLLSSISAPVSALAAQSLANIPQYYQVIQALLILSHWPVPVETIFQDPSLVYSGTAMQLALQHGLHMSGTEQELDIDDLRSEGVQDREAVRISLMRGSNSKLWTYCKIVCQSTSICYGLDPYTPSDRQQRGLPMPPSHTNPQQKVKLHGLLTTSVQTLSKYATHDNGTGNAMMHSMATVFDDQIRTLGLEAGPELLRSVEVLAARLHVVSFHLLDQTSSAPTARVIECYEVASFFIDELQAHDSVDDYVIYCSHLVYRTIVIAACILLRILRSKLRNFIEVSVSEQRYFTIINLLKRRSLVSNDLDAKNAAILGILWQSKTALRKADGSYDGLRVRTRTRGSYSVTWDCYWYWAREISMQRRDLSQGTSADQTHSNGRASNTYNPEIRDRPPSADFDFNDGWNLFEDSTFGDISALFDANEYLTMAMDLSTEPS